MGTRIVTYQSPNGATISLTREDVATLRLLGVWPRDAKGAEYCTVSHGERYGWQSAEDAAKVRETVGGARLNGKHTPGPWYVAGEQSGVTEYSDTRHIYAQSDKDAGGTGCVACVASSTANAALIAAAPDMLEALRAMVDHHTPGHWVDTSGPQYWQLNKARAAIRKATGEQ